MSKTNLYLSFFLILLNFNSTFAVESITAAGKVAYKIKSGELVSRDATLTVPLKGEGDIFLTSGGLISKSFAFATFKDRERNVFSVLFLNPKGAPKNTGAVFRGTYLRGTNKALYAGDIYTHTCNNSCEFVAYQEEWKKMLAEKELPEGFNYTGSFMFSKEIP